MSTIGEVAKGARRNSSGQLEVPYIVPLVQSAAHYENNCFVPEWAKYPYHFWICPDCFRHWTHDKSGIYGIWQLVGENECIWITYDELNAIAIHGWAERHEPELDKLDTIFDQIGDFSDL